MRTEVLPTSILVIERDDAVAIVARRDPEEFLAALSGMFHVGRTEVRAAPAAAAIAERIARDLRYEPGTVWGPTEFEEVVAALDGFDPMTGARIALRGVKVSDRVKVTTLGRGTVVGFTACKRVTVKLDTPRGALGVVHAARSQVKPVVRVGA